MLITKMIRTTARPAAGTLRRAYSAFTDWDALKQQKPAESLAMLNDRFEEDASPEDVVQWAANAGPIAMMSSFGIQAAVLLHMASQAAPDIPVVMVDTGFLPKETYEYAEELTQLLGLNLTVVSPAISAARMTAIYGEELWETDHKLYGDITKVEPMKRGMGSLFPKPQLTLSGLRRGQTETRKNMKHVTLQKDGTLKVLPMLKMSDQDVVDYFEHHRLPKHPLEAKGYVTVGDWHSSRPLEEGEDPRATRFGGRFQECGLHVTDDAEVDAMIGREAHAAAREARIELTREKSMAILESTPQRSESGITTHFVKKQLEDGTMCAKCIDVSAKLEKDGLDKLVGGISIANTSDAESDGVVLSQFFEQERAPFFLVKDANSAEPEEWRAIYSYGQWKKLVTA